MTGDSQKVPRSGPAREALREKGQFWTPDWVAEAMVGYLVAGGCRQVFDPAVGAGAFFRAAKAVAKEARRNVTLLGTEIDPDALQQAREHGLSDEDLANVQITDFVLQPPQGPFKGIVANPPYIRHHRLSSGTKAQLRAFARTLIGTALDGRAGIHIYFLLRALQLLDADGRLAFIMPADTCEGVFSSTLWTWITQRYRLEAVVTFTPEASPFPGVDTNPVIFLIRNAKPIQHFLWARCTKAQTAELKIWTLSGLTSPPSDSLCIHRRDLTEGVATGLSRVPAKGQSEGPTLGDFATVVRGIATGANDFFFLTASHAAALRLPVQYLVPAIGRTRDLDGDEIRSHTMHALERIGRPTVLFSPDGRPLDRFPAPVRAYLREGQARGLSNRPLIATRCPWYKMEARPIPAILFAYLGRRNARFIRNLAGVVPLTGFLCVYPRCKDPAFIGKLWQVLRHPETIANLSLVGKSYGSGAIKVEPRALETLPLPAAVLSEVGLQPAERAKQLPLCYDNGSRVAERARLYKVKSGRPALKQRERL